MVTIIKQWVGIASLAGVLTAGVTYPSWKAGTTELPVEIPAGAGTPAAGEMTDAKERLRAGLVTARAQAMAVEGRMAIPADIQRPIQMEAAATGAASATPAPPVAGTVPTAAQDAHWTPTPRPDLIAKADERFDNGDVAGARLWLEAALDAGDADAAFRLAETYDPEKLTEWRIVGVASDVSKARALYERAANGGVEAARQSVARLAP